MEMQKAWENRARIRSSSKAGAGGIQLETDSSTNTFHIRKQDAALVGSVRFSVSANYTDFTEEFSRELELAAADIENASGLVGHVKAFVREEGRSCMISIPGPGELQIKENTSDSVEAEAAFIVFQIQEDALSKIIRSHLDRWL